MAINDPNKPDNVTYIDPGNKTPEAVGEAPATEMTAEEAAALAGEGEKALHDIDEEQLESPATSDIGGEHKFYFNREDEKEMNGNKRTLAFQVSEEFFNEVQEYIKTNKMKLKDFGITAMRRMLEDAPPADPEAPAEPEASADPEAPAEPEADAPPEQE